ncbi:MAG: Cytochrome [Pedosphaera sp.]|nr:Cytochrome [Pedosphaera sp.]
MKNSSPVPGPSRFQLLRDYPKIRRDLTRYLAALAQQHGETVLLPIIYPTYMVSNPADIKHILISNPQNYHKTGGLKVGKELFGEGLVTSEIPLHPKQRRIMQPMFHRQSIANFGTIMTRTTSDWIRNWQDGSTINFGMELMQITLSIVGQALFSVDLLKDAKEIGNAFLSSQVEITKIQRGLPLPKLLRTSNHRRYQKALKAINEFVLELIKSRRNEPNPPDDLLSLLLASRYEDGSPMSNQQIRDEAVTALMAGHETVTNGLTWTFYLLAQHPDIQARVIKEVDEVLSGRLPTMADLPNLRYIEMVFAESLRIFPPAWILARRVLKEDSLPSGLTLPANSEVIMVQFVCHRNPKYFPEPERFNPDRFDPAVKKEWPQFAYFPFGAGPRFCIGESFARMEAALLIATFLQQFTFDLVPGQDIVPEPLITMRPRHGIMMRIKKRQ